MFSSSSFFSLALLNDLFEDLPSSLMLVFCSNSAKLYRRSIAISYALELWLVLSLLADSFFYSSFKFESKNY